MHVVKELMFFGAGELLQGSMMYVEVPWSWMFTYVDFLKMDGMQWRCFYD